MFITFIKSLVIAQIKRMDNKEIKELIAEEKKHLTSFLRIAKKMKLTREKIEKQLNFFLDKINELKKQQK